VELKKFFAIRKIYALKTVERNGTVVTENDIERQESSAEHSWSAMVLADWILSNFEIKVDKLRVFELIMYHDLVEIHAGDICISDVEGRAAKVEEEIKAAKMLRGELSGDNGFGSRFYDLFMEFEEQKSIEAKFAKMVETFDAALHELDHKKNWEVWTKEKLYFLKMKYFEAFPEIKKLFIEIADWVESEGYFNQ
jgi:putative hydrolases of HD superfamily